MHRYELTERGIIVVALLLVLPIFILAAVLAYSAFFTPPAQPPADQGTETSGAPPPSPVESPPSTISESPPPEGGGFNPPEISPPQGGIDSPPDTLPPEVGNSTGEPGTSNGHDPPQPPRFGPTGGNPSEGTLSFLFSPDLQDMLDAETSSMLGEFLRSSGNTDDSLIAIELPQLSDEDSEKIMTIMVGSFAARQIPEQRLAYIMHPGEIATGAFEVHLSFVPHRLK